MYIIISILSISSFAQKEGNIWYFGQNAGLDFNSGSPVELTNGMMDTPLGCATISDEDGKLLFYTDGITIWNRNHAIMPNGNGLMGGESSHSPIIVKQPGSNSLYYVFTEANVLQAEGLRYSIVDMNLQGGLGDVNVSKNVPITTPTFSKLTAIKHHNNTDFWIVTRLVHQNHFHSYLLTSTGFNITPVISSVGIDASPAVYNGYTGGYLKASLDGHKIASVMSGFSASTGYPISNIELLDFDNSTGILSNLLIIDFPEPWPGHPFGVEFSPNNNILYVSENGGAANIYQYNLQAGSSNAVLSSKVLIGQPTNGGLGGALQLGPDGKIYCANIFVNGNNSIGVINQPNLLGINCDYLQNGVQLTSGICKWGLPNFVNSIFNKVDIYTNDFCLGNSTEFSFTYKSNYDSILWNFDDSNSDSYFSTDSLAYHIFSDTGTYNVSLVICEGVSCDTFYKEIVINLVPFIDLGENTMYLCDSVIPIVLDASIPNGKYLWQDNSIDSTFEVNNEGIYSVEVSVNNCSLSDTVNVKDCKVIFDMPNIFTPNNDGYNDLFMPIKTRGVKILRTSIYNRWGVHVFDTNNGNIEWDGDEVSDGTYFYRIHYIDNQENREVKKGYVNLRR